MLKDSFWTRMAKMRPLTAIGLAAVVHALPGTAHADPSLLSEPPKLNYGNICIAPSPPRPMAMDWSRWDGKETAIAADQMLADAIRLSDGDAQVTRERALARRMLEHLSGGTSTSAPEAKARLATLLLDPKAGQTDVARATRLLSEATAAQRTGAALTMGKLIREGQLPGSTLADAARYLSIAAGLGDPAAALQLAALYADPGASLPFPDAATHFATLAAINVQTGLALGNCSIAVDVGDYLIGTDPQSGKARAAKWFEVAANAGDIRAIARLARFHESGDGAELDIGKAKALWDRAAEGGLVRAFVPAARLRLQAGEDLPSAVRLLDAAMANGDADSFLLAARHARGDFTGKADFGAMRRILEAAMQQPDPSIFTMEVLANADLTGQGAQVDKAAADQLFRRILASGLPDGEAIYGRYLVNAALGLDDGIRHLDHAAAAGSQSAAFQRAEIAYCMATDGGEQALETAAAAGSPVALRRLARLAYDRGNRPASLDFWHRAVNLGDRPAMVELAALALSGQAPGTDAKDLIRRAAAPGPDIVDGRLALSIAYRSGRLGDAGKEADRLLESLADSHRPDVEVELFRNGSSIGGEINPEELETRLAAAAEAGNAEAMYLLSRLLEGAQADLKEGQSWLIRAAAAGEVDALKELPTADKSVLAGVTASLANQPGCDVPRLAQQARLLRLQDNAADADRLMARAEKLADGRPRELYLLAEAFAAQEPGAADNPARATALFERSAAAGYSKSALSLAALYASGRLGTKDREAIDWYRQAAIAGEASALRELVRYASSQTGEATSATAMTALQQIAEHDDAAAMQAYGALLATQGPDRHSEGMAFLEKAAGKGDVQAMKTLARLFAAGMTGTVSAQESTRWTRLAAEKGDPEAMFQYAIALDLGFGVPVDRDMAHTWQQKARQNGFLR